MNGVLKVKNMSVGVDGEKMYKLKKQEQLPTRIYSKERLEEVKCISCENKFKIKIIEHQTIINEYSNIYQTLHDIFCPKCATPYIGIDKELYGNNVI